VTEKDAEEWIQAIMSNKLGLENPLPTQPPPKLIQKTKVEVVPTGPPKGSPFLPLSHQIYFEHLSCLMF
jgi:hypothetical protein